MNELNEWNEWFSVFLNLCRNKFNCSLFHEISFSTLGAFEAPCHPEGIVGLSQFCGHHCLYKPAIYEER